MLSSELKNSSLTSSKIFPNFITGSKIIAQNSELEKIFPKIGLPNSKEPIDVKFDLSTVQLDKVIHLAIKKFTQQWNEDRPLTRMKGLELFKMSRVIYLLEELNRRFNKKNGFTYTKDKVLLASSIPSYDGKVLIKGGVDVFQLVKTLFAHSKKYIQVDLISPEEIATQCKKIQIVFSSDNVDGAWDIATMSMRGIKSCMRWEARACPALVGSIVDPCCGIIYLTNGAKTQYGSKMLFRSVVRLAIHNNTGKPTLIVDRLYSNFYKNKPGENSKFDQQVKNIFIEYLRRKVPQCQVIDAQSKLTYGLVEYVVPKPANFGFLLPEEVSYRDTPILYGHEEYSSESILKTLGLVKLPKKKTTKPNKSKTLKTSPMVKL